MKAGLLFQAQVQGTFDRLSKVFWKDLKRGREVKKFISKLVDELQILSDLRNGIVKEFGEDGSLGPDKGDWAGGAAKLEELYNQEVEVDDPPKVSDGELVSLDGFSIFDIGVFEELGLLKD